PTCKFEPLGSPCTAATVCTNNACNGAGACGFASLNNGAACTDGNVCTVGDTCTAGACVGGPRNCDDLNGLTTDLCTPATVGFENLATAARCNDGNAATAGDICSGGACMGFIRHATLTRTSGPDPSTPGFPAVADVRTDGTRVRASLINLNAAQFPATAACQAAQITIGGISAPAPPNPFAAQAVPLVRATAVNFVANGTVAAG